MEIIATQPNPPQLGRKDGCLQFGCLKCFEKILFQGSWLSSCYFLSLPLPWGSSQFQDCLPHTESGNCKEGGTPSFLAELHNIFPRLSEGILPTWGNPGHGLRGCDGQHTNIEMMLLDASGLDFSCTKLSRGCKRRPEYATTAVEIPKEGICCILKRKYNELTAGIQSRDGQKWP